MADEQQQDNAREFMLQRIYIKDVSFESPNTPAMFQQKSWDPKTNVELKSHATKLGDDVYEVVLAITATTTLSGQTAYLIEVQQAGIFTMKGFGEQETGPMLGAYCPNILFPYAREVITDLSVKGGFPQLILQPVNFDAMYAQHLQAQQQAGAAGGGAH